jgi:glycosyltransferase involved in cell wall biosynthesis
MVLASVVIALSDVKPTPRRGGSKLSAAVGRRAEIAGGSDTAPATAKSAATAKVVVVMPARNAARTLEQTVSAIPADVVNEIILVDDKSTDGTVEIARRLPVHLIWHPHNVGYGGNQKTCYLEALQRGADVVVMLHPDGQYEPSLIPRMVEPILRGEADMVLGSRLAIPGAWKSTGMPRYKYLANRGLTVVENAVLGTDFSELHTGYRAFSRELLLTVPFLRNSIDFVFDSEMIMQAVHFGFRIAEVPARTRYFPEASSASAGQSIVYGIKTLASAGRFMLHRGRILRSRKFMP